MPFPARLLRFAPALVGLLAHAAGCGDDTTTTSGSGGAGSGGDGPSSTTSSSVASSSGSPASSSSSGEPTTTSSGGAGGEGGAGGGGGSGGEGGTNVIETLATAVGELTIEETYDGDTCTTTYAIDAIEDRSAPWMCPDCVLYFTGDYDAVATTCESFREYERVSVGFTDDGALFLTRDFETPFEIGSALVEGDGVSLVVDFFFEDFGTEYRGQGEGSLTLGAVEGDPLRGWYPSAEYSCGWPRNESPPEPGSALLEEGELLPDGVFLDACGDRVRLLDLTGRYLIIGYNVADDDCSVCNESVNAIPQIEADAAALGEEYGIEVLTVHLLMRSLTDAHIPATATEIADWTERASTTGVVLADRGYGPTTMAYLEDRWYGAYPGYIVVAPDGTVLWAREGGGAAEDVISAIELDVID